MTAAEAAASMLGQRPWNPDEDDTLVCRAVRTETHDVKTFVFTAPEPRRFSFRPGQFLTFAFPVGGETIHRCYTVSSAPTRPDTVSITVKRVPGGPVSNWLHDTMTPGAAVQALGPMGEFSCFPPRPHAEVAGAAGPRVEGRGAPKYLFLSGGSGITPLMSMARTFHDLAVPRDIVFAHAARSPTDIVFRDELALMARLSPSFRLATLCEADGPGESWAGFRGRLSPALLPVMVPDFRDREVFCCGPAPFMAAARTILREAGFDMARYHEESFDFATLSGSEKAEVLDAEAELDGEAEASPLKTFRVEFARTKRAVEVREDQTVLQAARAQGVRLPSSCTKGVCGTCKSKLLSGTVAMSHGGGIRQREIDAGMALLCCSRPTSDLLVDR